MDGFSSEKNDAISGDKLSSLTKLDRDYSPSLWNNRGLISEETIERHVSTTLEESKKAAAELYSKTDVQYGSTPKNTLDLYCLSSSVALGAQLVVYVHGGYWQFLRKKESAFLAIPICKSSPPGTDTIFLAADYVLATEKQYGQQASMRGICGQMQELFRFVSEMARTFQCSGINFIGHSAGAHLVATMLSQLNTTQAAAFLPLIRGVWLVSGIYDLEPISQTYVDEPLKLTKGEIELCSPMNLAEALVQNLMQAPNAILKVVFGQYDSPAFREQSEKYHQKIKQEVENSHGTSGIQGFKLADLLDIPDRDHFTVVDQLHDSILLKDIQDHISQENAAGIELASDNVKNLDQIDFSSRMKS